MGKRRAGDSGFRGEESLPPPLLYCQPTPLRHSAGTARLMGLILSNRQSPAQRVTPSSMSELRGEQFPLLTASTRPHTVLQVGLLRPTWESNKMRSRELLSSAFSRGRKGVSERVHQLPSSLASQASWCPRQHCGPPPRPSVPSGRSENRAEEKAGVF